MTAAEELQISCCCHCLGHPGMEQESRTEQWEEHIADLWWVCFFLKVSIIIEVSYVRNVFLLCSALEKNPSTFAILLCLYPGGIRGCDHNSRQEAAGGVSWVCP